MKTSYRIKHALFPTLMPVAVPTLAVPASLLTAWSIHAAQNIRLSWIHHKNTRSTPTELPKGAGRHPKSQEEAISRLRLEEFDPIALDGYTSTGLRAVPDLAPMYFDSGRRFRGRFYAYPRQFHETLIPVSGGTPISAIVGLHHAKLPRPGLVIVHGLMNSKRQDLVRVVTQRAFLSWGFNVCAIDLRGFGRSAESVSVPTGAGGIEAGDLLDVARYLKQFPHFTSIGALGFSLGAGACLNAAGSAEVEKLFDGGVMAVSPPINLASALNRFEHPPEDEEHLLTYHFFRFLLSRMLGYSELMKWARKKMPVTSKDWQVGGFIDYLRNLVAWGYLGRGRNRERDPDRLLEVLLRVSSPSRALPHIRVPTFILHAKDDPLTRLSPSDIALLERTSASNPLLRYHLTDRGGHTAYVAVDPSWFYGVVRSYFTYLGEWRTKKQNPFLNMQFGRKTEKS